MAETLAEQLTGKPVDKVTQANSAKEFDPSADTFEGVLGLETNYYAIRYIQSRHSLPDLTPTERALAPILSPMHGVDQISNQFAPEILSAYLEDDPDEALRKFREIDPTTIDQQMATLVNDSQFLDIHTGLKAHLADSRDEINEKVTERLDPKRGQIAWNDRYQFNGNETSRSLEGMLSGGMEIKIDPDQMELIKRAQEKVGTGPLPLSEILKNDRILTINGLSDSKISLAVHDSMDHVWLYNLMHSKGLHQKFYEFFESIGDPSFTDIFKREGEIVASVGFGVRCYATQESGFVPIFSAQDIRDKFEEYFDASLLEDRHMEAFRILRNMHPHSREWQSLGFTYSNNVVELDEQRRKHGKIKQRDPQTHKIVGELSIVDPDYLSLVVELHHELLSSKNKTRNNLFMFHILFEEYLQGIAEGIIAPDSPLNIHVQRLDEYDFAKTTIPPDRIRWMFRNYGFTATKDVWV